MPRALSQRALARRAVPQDRRWPEAVRVRPRLLNVGVATLAVSVLPVAYGGGEVPEANLGLMPALVTSYDQGLRWKTSPIGKEWAKILEDKGIVILTWVWQAGGIASKTDPIVSPDDAKGQKVGNGDERQRCLDP